MPRVQASGEKSDQTRKKELKKIEEYNELEYQVNEAVSEPKTDSCN